MNLILILLASLPFPQQAAPDPQEAKARAIFQEMQAAYNAAKTLTVTTTTKTYSEKDGKKHLDTSAREQLKARRPSFFRMEIVSEKPAQAVHREEAVSDGKFVWNYDAQDKHYIKSPVGGLFAKISSATGAPGSFFLSPENSEGFLKPNPLITLHYLGREKVAGAECEKFEVHIGSPNEFLPASVQTYTIGADHLLRRLVSQMKIKDTLYTTVIEVQSSELNKNLPDALFTFMPPPGATEKALPE